MTGQMSNDAGPEAELALPVRVALRTEHMQVLDKIHEPAHSLARALVADQRAHDTVALGLYGASWLAPRRGRHAGGVFLGLAGGLVSAGAGYLGAHLTLARKVGTRHPVFKGDETP